MADVGITFGGDAADARRAAEAIIRELEKVSRQALETSAVMSAALGGVSKDFGGMTKASVTNRKELVENERQVRRNDEAFGGLSRRIITTNQALSLMGKAMSLLKWPVLISGASLAAQAINALLAGATSLLGALGSLGGLLGTIPGAILTVGTAAVTAKLAFNGLKEALDGNKEAFQKLTPEAKNFVRTLNGIKPIINDLRRAAQQGLFPGLTEGLNSIFSTRNVSIFRRNLKLMGDAMGDTFAKFGKLVGSSGFGRDLDFLLKSAAANFRILGDAAVNVVDAFRNIAVVAQPLVNYITSLIGRFGEWIQKAAEAGRESGSLARFFDETKQTLQELGRILGPIGRALADVFRIAAPYGHEILQLLAGAADQLERFTSSARGENALNKYFADAIPSLVAMGRLLRDIAGVLLSFGTTPALTGLLDKLRTELLPILDRILKGQIQEFLPAVVDLAIAFADLAENILGASSPLVGFVKVLTGLIKGLDWLADNVPGINHVLSVFFGLLAVGKITGITNAIWGLSRAWAGVAAGEAVATAGARGFRAALISTGIGAALVALGVAAELIITHWSKVAPYFKATFVTLVEYAKLAAFTFLNVWLTAFDGLLRGVAFVAGIFDKVFGTNIAKSVNRARDAIHYTLDKIRPDIGKVRDAWASVGAATDEATAAVGRYASAAQALAVGSAQAKGGRFPAAATTAGATAATAGSSVLPESFKSTHQTAGLSGFPALDVMMKPGTIVGSPASGTITRISGGPGVRDARVGVAGYSIYLAGDNGSSYFMTHFGSVSVKVGQKVQRGTPLGTVFSWGARTHIHIGRSENVTPTLPGSTTSAISPSTPTFKDETTKPDKPTSAARVDILAAQQRQLYIEENVSQIRDFPKIQRAIRNQVEALRKLWRAALKDGIITDEELAKIQSHVNKLQATFQRGLRLESLTRQFREFRAGLKNVVADAVKSLQPVTAAGLRSQLSKIGEQISDALEKGLAGRAARLLARARELRQQLVQVLAENIQSAKQKVADAMSNVMSGALDAFDRQTQKLIDAAEKAVGDAFGVVRGQTAASRRLAEFRAQRDEANFRKSVAEANKELADSETNLAKVRSTVGASADDLAQAEDRVLKAKEAIYELSLDAQDRALQKEADAQEVAYQDALEAARKQTTEQREILRGHLEERMRMIQKQYDDEEITAEEAQKQILELLGEYGIDTTEAMGATAVFTRSLEELGKAISKLAQELKNVRELATPSSTADTVRPNDSTDKPQPHSNAPAVVVYPGGSTTGGGVNLPVMARGGIVPSSGGISVGRDHVLIAASPGEAVLTQDQQAALMSPTTSVIVQINRPLLLGRSLQVADDLADAVAPAISRRIGYRY